MLQGTSLGRQLRPPPSLERVAVGLLLFALAIQILHGALQSGMAYDEFFHIPTGVTYVSTGIRRLTLDHTPLGHLLAGWALSPLSLDFDRVRYVAVTTNPGDAWGTFQSFWTANQHSYRAILLVGRIPFMSLGVLGGVYVYLLSRSLFGGWPGLLSLAFYAFCPGIVAWSRFVYMDALLAVFGLATLTHLVWYLRSRGEGQLLCLALALGATLATKYSGVFLLPFVLGVPLLPPAWLGLAPVLLGRRLWHLGLMVVVALGVLWACFGFPSDFWFYTRGVTGLYGTVPKDYKFYLVGRFQAGGFPEYYLVNFLLKSTLPTLALTLGVSGGFVASVIGWVRGVGEQRQRARARAVALGLLLGPALLFFVLTSWKALPLGFRYLVPLYPLLYVAFGGLGTVLWARPGVARVLLTLLVVFHAGSSLSRHPDQMAYFHEGIGGPERGLYWLNDASIDAGHNLPRLAAFLRLRGNPVVKMLPFGTDVPENYGIRRQVVTQADWDGTPSPGLYVIPTQWLVYGQLSARESAHRDWLVHYRPLATIGGSYYIYEFR